ncbi:hypothetical protein F4W67_26265 [Pseudomonas caricapapayae]|nr:hypothetical protein F4W67_26265 [Pseudomonas caricapapayae]RMV98417.1 hypothetical protein ALP01_200481 [Pseudomonas caricapapayae]
MSEPRESLECRIWLILEVFPRQQNVPTICFSNADLKHTHVPLAGLQADANGIFTHHCYTSLSSWKAFHPASCAPKGQNGLTQNGRAKGLNGMGVKGKCLTRKGRRVRRKWMTKGLERQLT